MCGATDTGCKGLQGRNGECSIISMCGVTQGARVSKGEMVSGVCVG